MPALASRSAISMTRLVTARSDGPAALERPDEGDLVGVFEIAANRQSARDPGDRPDDRLEPLGEVHRGRLTFEGRVGRHDHLDERLPVPCGRIRPIEKLADPELLRSDAIDR